MAATKKANGLTVKTLAEMQAGPVTETTDTSCVAIVYPDDPQYDLTPVIIEGLDLKYAHLKQLDVKDKKAYKELGEAIKDIKKHRSEITAQENAIKTPLNAFRKKVIDGANFLRDSISTIENRLLAEKQRIDDIIAEELAAQQRLWNENLKLTINLAQIRHGMKLDELQARLQAVEDFDIAGYDFGDQLEDAKANKANAHMQVTQAIAMEKQRIELEAQAAESKRLAEEAEAKRKAEAEEQRKKDEAAAAAAAAAAEEIAQLKAQMEALKKANEPKLEAEISDPQGLATSEDEPDEPVETHTYKAPCLTRMNTAAPTNVINTSGKSPFEDAETEEDETGANDVDVLCNLDVHALNSLADELEATCRSHKVIDFKSETAYDAAMRVIGNVEKTVIYLRGIASGEAK